MNNITNVTVLIKPDETIEDVIAEICEESSVGPNEHFIFSAIYKNNELKINSIENYNVYTIREVVEDLFTRISPTNIVYIQPPLEQWLLVFKPLISSMVNKAYPTYKKLIDYDDMLSILYMTLLSLYNKGYYLHNHLIYKSYINALNMECRTLIDNDKVVSLDQTIANDGEDKDLTLLDQIEDKEDEDKEYNEYWYNKFLEIKKCMLEDMSEFEFQRIMIQLKSKTVDRKTSYILDKYRCILSPEYAPRPNARGKNK